MELRVEAEGVGWDPWVEDFLRTTVMFAVWHHGGRIAAVDVRLDGAVDWRGETFLRCGLRAETAEGESIEAGATGANLYEAIREAVHLLEVSLYAPRSPRQSAPPNRLAA